MSDRGVSLKSGVHRLLHEPLVHFFILGVVLFSVDHLLRGEPRLIVVTPGLVADLERRFSDEHGRAPNPAERAKILDSWKREEALYREALRRNLDRNDVAVRGLLIAKMKAEAELEIAPVGPSDDELRAWLRSHRETYELPLRYDFQYLEFPKTTETKESGHAGIEPLSRARTALEEGTPPSELGRPVVGGNLTAEDLTRRLASPLATRIVRLSPGTWETVEGKNEVWLVRVQGISGGLPELDEVRERVLGQWTSAAREKAIEAELDETVNLYRFEDRDAE